MIMSGGLRHHEMVKLAQQILRRRELRTEFFEASMLDPGPWDILLGLFVAESKGQTSTRESLSKFGNLPHSVAERWINYLDHTHMITSTMSGAALAFHAVCLTPKAKGVLADYFAALLSPHLAEELAARHRC